MADPAMPATWCLIAGDNHGHFAHLVKAAKQYRSQYILSVGDLEPQKPLAEELAAIEALGTQFLFCPGNHCTDRAETWAHVETASDRNMHGQVVQVGHLKVAFLGGVFRAEVWCPPQSYGNEIELFSGAKYDSYADYEWSLLRKTRGPYGKADPFAADKLRKHRTTIFPADYRRLAKMRCDVLVSHEAGAWGHRHGHQALDDLRHRMGAMTHFWGHHHCRRFRTDARGAITVGVGYCGITCINGTTIIRPGDYDRQRAEPL